MTELTYKRSVRYYHLYFALVDRNNRTHETTIYPPVDWSDRLSLHLAEASTIEESNVSYYAHPSDAHYALSMHKPLDSTFLTEINSEEQGVKDFTLLDDKGSKYLANASAVVLGMIEGRLIVGIASGANSSAPGITALLALLQEALRLPSGYVVRQKAVMLQPDTELLRRADGAIAFSGEFLSENMTVSDPLQEGVKNFAGRVGAGIKLYVRAELTDGTSREAISKMLGQVRNLNFNRGKIDPRVKVVEGDTEKVLNLARHKFASEIFLSPNDLIGAKFSSLIQRAVENFDESYQTLQPIVIDFIPARHNEGASWPQRRRTRSSSAGESWTLF